MKTTPRPIAITTGEPAGIGPDICLYLAKLAIEEGWHDELVLLGDLSLLTERARLLGMDIPLVCGTDDRPGQTEDASVCIRVLHHALSAPCTPGQLDARNGPYVLALLDAAIAGCQSNQFAALVTAPLQKSVICDAGFAGFQGHTEYLAEKTGTPQVVMMLASGEFRVALATTHLPLSAVSDAITRDGLTSTIRILNDALKRDFGCETPHILVAGLNPHAGEAGHLGREEIDTLIPVLEQLRSEGLRLTGPLPADTLFQPKYLGGADAVLAMYHDQGLPVLKYASFGRGINITLGLPIIRTSVDHGTALDLAGTGQASADSLLAAWDHACFMVRHRELKAKATA